MKLVGLPCVSEYFREQLGNHCLRNQEINFPPLRLRIVFMNDLSSVH